MVKMKQIEKDNKIRNEGICKCGHESKDHCYSLTPHCDDLKCDICDCQNFQPEKNKDVIKILKIKKSFLYETDELLNDFRIKLDNISKKYRNKLNKIKK